ncbi:Fic family protein [Desulfitobacterium chlororespirans]|uniref:Fic family protein n=1 Tax=Desulfitobacterium chlororespirans TaxID=51616 RepID=UPI001FA82FA7|nr:Fic family protein [Desulfitobacterium chlororespirans]
MRDVAWDKFSLDEKAVKFSKYMEEPWKIHCFREGNTRTVVTFCCQFAESRGFSVDRTLFQKHSAYVRTSLVAALAYFSELGDRASLNT